MKIILLAAYTERSKAYVQVLHHIKKPIEAIILYGKQNTTALGQSSQLLSHPKNTFSQIFVPDFSESLLESSKKINCPLINIEKDDINSDAIYNMVSSFNPDLIIFSGYGGQIVKNPLLKFNLLHIHSGWVPQYKGSMTLFYSILEGNNCGASAFLLNANIDEGKVIKRKWYPLPSSNDDIDYVFDSMIRADLLKDVLNESIIDDKLLFEEISEKEEMHYYIMHPLLKAFTFLKLSKQ